MFLRVTYEKLWELVIFSVGIRFLRKDKVTKYLCLVNTEINIFLITDYGRETKGHDMLF